MAGTVSGQSGRSRRGQPQRTCPQSQAAGTDFRALTNKAVADVAEVDGRRVNGSGPASPASLEATAHVPADALAPVDATAERRGVSRAGAVRHALELLVQVHSEAAA
jgi:hypothetical protein